MTVIPCTHTPGLQVFDLMAKEWISVEANATPYQHIFVLLGMEMQNISPELVGALHRVAKNDRPRLSLVYEWRPRVSLR